MARIRSIKPEFWKNEQLGEMSSDAQLLFIGLWNLSDRRGFLEDRPKRIKAELFPYRDIDIEECISCLMPEFIRRVAVDTKQYIHIINFAKHQVCNVREPESIVPTQYWNSTDTVPTPLEGEGEGNGIREGERKGKEGKGDSVMIFPKLEDVKSYFKSKGYDKIGAEKFFNYYTETEWKDKDGNPIKNWKLKAVSVWFRDEYKIKSDRMVY